MLGGDIIMNISHLSDMFRIDSATSTNDGGTQLSPLDRELRNNFRITMLFAIMPLVILIIPFFSTIRIYHDNSICLRSNVLDQFRHESRCSTIDGNGLDLMGNIGFLNVSNNIPDGITTVKCCTTIAA